MLLTMLGSEYGLQEGGGLCLLFPLQQDIVKQVIRPPRQDWNIQSAQNGRPRPRDIHEGQAGQLLPFPGVCTRLHGNYGNHIPWMMCIATARGTAANFNVGMAASSMEGRALQGGAAALLQACKELTPSHVWPVIPRLLLVPVIELLRRSCCAALQGGESKHEPLLHM